jgi:hypothetical protein
MAGGGVVAILIPIILVLIILVPITLINVAHVHLAFFVIACACLLACVGPQPYLPSCSCVHHQSRLIMFGYAFLAHLLLPSFTCLPGSFLLGDTVSSCSPACLCIHSLPLFMCGCPHAFVCAFIRAVVLACAWCHR